MTLQVLQTCPVWKCHNRLFTIFSTELRFCWNKEYQSKARRPHSFGVVDFTSIFCLKACADRASGGSSWGEWGWVRASASLSNLCQQRSSSQAPERTLQHPGISQGESQTPFTAQNQHYPERDRDKWNIIHGGVQGRCCSHLQKMGGTQLSPCPGSPPFVTGNVQNEICV